MRHCLLISLGLALVLAAVARADNWPQWRGPAGNNASTETGLPATWSKTENVAWRLLLPGPAGATPAVWGDRIFLTSLDGDDLVLICASTAGKELWKRTVGTGNRNVVGDEGNYASPSPSTDGRHVWSFMASGDLACYDFDGSEIWKLNLQNRYGKFRIQFGMATTPLLDGDRLYLQLIHSDGALVVALDKCTGAEIWQAKRPSDARDESEHSYASPVIYRDGQTEFLLTHGADYVVAHSLVDGSELWRCGGLNPKGKYNNTLRFIASPAVAPGLIVVPSAKNGPVFGLTPNNHGDITDSAAAHIWTRPAGTPDVPTPLIHDGLVYLCRENGNLICIDAQSGQQYYEERTHRHRHRASPLYVDGKILLTARDGTITIVKPGKQFEVLATNNMEEEISASPAVADGTLYLRSFAALYAIRNRGGAE